MLKKYWKKFLKSEFVEKITGKILYLYLHIVNATSYVEIKYEEGFSKDRFLSASNVVFALWHQEIALSTLIFKPIAKNVNPVISPHSDGKILACVVENIGASIIQGSTNKSAILAAKTIISSLRNGKNIVITPDGPKGPARIINSNIMAIAAKTSAFVVPLSIKTSRYIEFNSWDKFHFPLPFSKIEVKFGTPISASGEKEADDTILQTSLNNLSQIIESPISNKNSKIFELFLLVGSIIIFPIQTGHLLYRLLRGKETFERILERFSIASDVAQEGMIWIHSASVGESIIAFSLIDILLKKKKNLKFLLTTGTLTSANLVATKMEPYNHFSASQVITHQFLPIDNIFITTHFINYWKPKLGIFIESELWPNIITAASNTCPLILVNARMSGRSFAKWQNFKFIIKNIANKFTHTLVQSNQDKERYEALGFNDTMMVGNLKYVQKDDIIDQEFYSQIASQIGERKVIFAASTHPSEEEIIISAFLDLRKKQKDLLLIIAPRHPKRTDDIFELLEKHKLKVIRRTSDEKISAKVNVFILDTIGEMSLIFKLKPITFMGGTFTIGGHNILEPAKYESLIIYGPNMSNFQEISNEFLEKKAAIQVSTGEGLRVTLEEAIHFPQKTTNKYTKAALEIIKSKQMVEKLYLQKIEPYL